jgi:glycosyltransferase involved in cell wall biosynthesis
MGLDITVVTRTSYIDPSKTDYRGVRLVSLYSPRLPAVEAFWHTLSSVIYAARKKFAIIHFHAIGPSLLSPLARLLGMRVIVTHHGQDYLRKKWGIIVRSALKLGEKTGLRFADKVIVLSGYIRQRIVKRNGSKKIYVIPNGFPHCIKAAATDFLEKIRVKKLGYILYVGRLVQEKGIDDLIDAFRSLASNGIKLVIAGGSDRKSAFSRRLVAENEGESIVFAGSVTGGNLRQLYSHARLFVLPSYHEGISLALLEALGYGLDVLASDIPANKDIGLSDDCFFITGDVGDLASKITAKLEKAPEPRNYDSIAKKYDWESIARKTFELYKDICE